MSGALPNPITVSDEYALATVARLEQVVALLGEIRGRLPVPPQDGPPAPDEQREAPMQVELTEPDVVPAAPVEPVNLMEPAPPRKAAKKTAAKKAAPGRRPTQGDVTCH